MKGKHLFLIGLFLLAVWLVVVMTQVETNEAYIAGQSSVNVYKPNWLVLMQIPNLVIGNESSSTEAIQTIVGWGVELLFLVFVFVGYEVAHHAASGSGKIMASLFGFGSLLIVGFNGYTDYQYGVIGSGVGGHILFSAITAFIVGFFGTLALLCLELGWKKV